MRPSAQHLERWYAMLSVALLHLQHFALHEFPHSSAPLCKILGLPAHTPANVSIRQHPSASVSIRQHTQC
jgi:hypothetical protein